MTQVFTAAGELVLVTVLEMGPCTVVPPGSGVRDGYVAAQPARAARVARW
jgi:ribosomal protein L3